MGSPLERGRAALGEAAWEDAKTAFTDALAVADTPDARDGLGLALWWLGDVRGGLEERERAYAGYVEAGRRNDAAGVALWVSAEHASAFGNHAVANGWFARAERLLEGTGPCRERVRLLVKRAQKTDDGAAALAIYEEAIAMARACEARELEVLVLSCIGCLLVGQGRVADGFARLDDAMAATVAGELREHGLVALTSCNMLLACERAHDMARAIEWLRVSTAWAKERRCLPFFAFCRVAYGGVLMAQGRWSEAEDELVDSMRRYEATHPALSAKAAVKLAELRIAQGQPDAAEELLRPWREHALATCAVACLHLVRGETELAVSRLERRMQLGGSDPSMLAPVCELIVRAFLARGERAQAEGAAARLRAMAAEQSGSVLAALADAASGEVATATDDPAAPALLQRAFDAYTELGMPYAAARVRLCLARALAKGRKEAAIAEARAALATFEELGGAACAELASALVKELTGGPAPPVRRRVGADALTRREHEVLGLLRGGRSNPEIALELDISAKTAEHHVRAILAKLNVKSRAAAAAWAERQLKSSP